MLSVIDASGIKNRAKILAASANRIITIAIFISAGLLEKRPEKVRGINRIDLEKIFKENAQIVVR